MKDPHSPTFYIGQDDHLGVNDLQRRAGVTSRCLTAMIALAFIATISVQGSAQDTSAAAPSRLTSAASYIGLLQSNISGGVRPGTVYGGAAALQLTLALDRLVPWPSAQLFLFVLDTH